MRHPARRRTPHARPLGRVRARLAVARGAFRRGAGAAAPTPAAALALRAAYGDEKVANREIRVWHFVIENGY